MHRASRRIGMIGITARVVVGVGLLVTAIMTGPGWSDVIGAVTVLPVIAVAATLAVNHSLVGSAHAQRGRVPWSGTQALAAAAILLIVIAVGTGLTFATAMDGGALYLFFGASMLIAALMDYPGCEVLAIPNLVLRRRDAIWCPLYSPLDRADPGSDA